MGGGDTNRVQRAEARWGAILAATLALLSGTTASAYEAGEVDNGGTITGTVRLRGTVPEPRAFPMVLYPNGSLCKVISDGRGHVLLKEFNTDEADGLQDAVIAVQSVQTGKRWTFRENKLVTVNCMFHPANVPQEDQFGHIEDERVHIHPLVSIMRNHEVLSVLNLDPVLHAIQAYQKEKGNRVVTFPIPVSTKEHGKFLDMDEDKHIVQIICAMHEYMQTWGWIVDNPYFAKSRRDGGYSIDQLPPGTYIVKAWHPHLKPVEEIVTVPENGAVQLDFEFDAGQVRRPLYETQTQFRIGPERDPTVDLKGCDGPYCVRRKTPVHDHD